MLPRNFEDEGVRVTFKKRQRQKGEEPLFVSFELFFFFFINGLGKILLDDGGEMLNKGGGSSLNFGTLNGLGMGRQWRRVREVMERWVLGFRVLEGIRVLTRSGGRLQ